MNLKSESLINKIFFEKYRVIKKIGQGSFGRIYTCQNIVSNELYAMKVEQNSCLNKVLEIESNYLNYLKGYGIPECKFFGKTDKYIILIETLLGKSLENLFSETHGNFNLKDICMIGIQILDRIEYIHNKDIIHRDIKPDNFVIGKDENKNIIYMIDFGLAKRYRDEITKEHIPFKMTKRLTGTARYASINALKGGEQSRKDDLESLNYMLLYFLKGSLPWQGVSGFTKGEKYKKIYHIKKTISVDKLYENFPNEFKEIYLYVKKLEFDENPNYEFIRKLLIDVVEKKCGESYDNFFTWCKKINLLSTNYFYFNNNDSYNNNDESGKTQKSTKIQNIANSNILFNNNNNKKIKKISVTFIDKRNKNKNKIMNCAYNFNVEEKRNKSLLLDNIYNIYDLEDNPPNSPRTKNKEIIVTSDDKENNSDNDYSIEGEIDKKNKKNGKKDLNELIISKNNKNKNNKINILSLTKINKKKGTNLINTNKYKNNLNKTKTCRDFFDFSRKNFNYIINSQLSNRTKRIGLLTNRAKDSHNKSSNKIKSKSKSNNSNNNISPNKVKKTKNKLFSMYNTHTNIRTKQKPKIKHSPRNLQLKAKMKREKSNHKYSILLEDFMKKKKINSKNKYDKSKVSRIKNYFRNIQIYKIKNSDLKDISTYSTKKMVKSTNNSKNKNRKNNINSFSKNNKTKSYHSISNKQLKIHQLFNKNKNKKNIIININKCYNKRNNSNNSCNSYNKTNNKKQESYISRMYNNKKFNKDSRNNTINIESIVFIGDINDPSSKSASKSKNNSKDKKFIYTPKNIINKNKIKNDKINFLKKFRTNILCNNTNNSIKNINTSRIKKKRTNKKINYNNISLKLVENKYKLDSKNNGSKKRIVYNINNKKLVPISFNNLTSNIRTKKKVKNNNYFYNNSLFDKKFFIQNSFNSSDNNYILNNINNNNIIVNNYNNCTNNNNNSIYPNKKIVNSFCINNKNIFPDNNDNNSNINLGQISNSNNSIFKEIIFGNNKKANKNKNSRKNLMKFIKKY